MTANAPDDPCDGAAGHAARSALEQWNVGDQTPRLLLTSQNDGMLHDPPPTSRIGKQALSWRLQAIA